MLTTWPCHGRVTPLGASTSSSSFWKVPQPSSPLVRLAGSRAGSRRSSRRSHGYCCWSVSRQQGYIINDQWTDDLDENWWIFSVSFSYRSFVPPPSSQVTEGPWSHVKDHRIITGRSPLFTRRFLCRGWSAWSVDWSIMKMIGYRLSSNSFVRSLSNFNAL